MQTLPPDRLWPRLDALDAAIAAQDVEAALALRVELVTEWHRGDVAAGATGLEALMKATSD